MRRNVLGAMPGVVSTIVLTALMVPVRSHVSIATTGLILVIPVVVGVIAGGYVGGLASVAAGFLVYDFVFIPPYYTLSVGAAQNWVALIVYVVVMVLVAQVVARLQVARQEAQRRAAEARRLFELSELLVEDRSLHDMLESIVTTTLTVFEAEGVALLLPDGDRLTVAAAAGHPLSPEDLRHLEPRSGQPVPVGTGPGPAGELRTVALAAAGRPVGLLAMRGLPNSDTDRSLLGAFANHAALALERTTLRQAALRSEMLEEVDRVRDALLGAVSHDLRTPLATMKIASSTLLDPPSTLSEDDRRELYGLLDVQTDRLTRLVAGLLDLTRFEAGVLKVDSAPISVLDLVAEAVTSLRPSLGDRRLDIEIPDDLPQVEADPLLIGQVLVNLIDNADRLGPPATAITISAVRSGPDVVVSVADLGPGVPPSERHAVFESFVRFDTGGRSGLGLSIARTFVEAHGGKIWVEEAEEGGARFALTLAAAQPASGLEDGRG